MSSAFLPPPHLAALRAPPRRRSCVTCSTPAPRATRLSLPTYRERRFLEEHYVERAKGRAVAVARATAFTLKVWPLVVRDLTADEVARRARWLRGQRAQGGGGDELAGGAASPGEAAPGEAAPELAGEMVLALRHDSELLDSPELEEMRLLAEAAHVGFSLPPWAYVVRVRAGKPVLGKRAVQRNRAKRRIRAAASSVCPDHARRGLEYVFTANPEVLTIAYAELVDEVRTTLKRTGCWEEEMTLEGLRRDRYCKR